MGVNCRNLGKDKQGSEQNHIKEAVYESVEINGWK